jgi:hypothetical protein
LVFQKQFPLNAGQTGITIGFLNEIPYHSHRQKEAVTVRYDPIISLQSHHAIDAADFPLRCGSS